IRFGADNGERDCLQCGKAHRSRVHLATHMAEAHPRVMEKIRKEYEENPKLHVEDQTLREIMGRAADLSHSQY
ncbi:hypothetical protein PFISCL1PPCAC_1019, partial [Pristionchus fissidentatus]